MPVPQKPDPQAPALQFAAVGALLAAAARAENVEYSVVKWCFPQAGHSMLSVSAARRTSLSNFFPQSSHEYSKIGICPAYQFE